MHRLFEPVFPPVLGFLWAAIGTSTLWLADAASDMTTIPAGWIQLGGTLGLIAGLSHVAITLWRELQSLKRESREERELSQKEASEDREKHRIEIATLNQEIRNEKREQNDKLIAAIEELSSKNR